MNKNVCRILLIVFGGILLGGLAVALRENVVPSSCDQHLPENNSQYVRAERARRRHFVCSMPCDEGMRTACEVLSAAKSWRTATALDKYIDAIDLGSCHATTEIVAALEKPLCDVFLWKKELQEFSSAQEYESFAIVNTELVKYFGCREIRDGRLELAETKEYLTYRTLNEYCEKFRKEGDAELVACAEKFLAKWVEHIESSDGFTRKSACYLLFLNTEYANMIRPEAALSHQEALRAARSTANGLVNCGYTPKWLKEFDADAPSSP